MPGEPGEPGEPVLTVDTFVNVVASTRLPAGFLRDMASTLRTRGLPDDDCIYPSLILDPSRYLSSISFVRALGRHGSERTDQYIFFVFSFCLVFLDLAFLRRCFFLVRMQRSLSKAHFAINIALPIVALLSIVLRFIARRRQKAHLKGDDWVVVAAMVCHVTAIAISYLR